MNWVTRISLAVIAVAVIYYTWFLWQFAMNIPLGDDIRDVLLVLTRVEQTDALSGKIALLFEQHNDHRTFASRLVYWALYLLQGEVDFRLLTFVANAGLLLLLGILCLQIPGNGERALLMLPAALVLFQIRAYGLTLWPMAAFAYFYVYVYGFASLLCLQRLSPLNFALAILFALAATFTLASGQLVWLLGLACLAQQRYSGRDIPWYWFAGWLLATVAVLALWRLGLETPNTPGALLVNLLSQPVYYLHYMLVLLGSAIGEQSVALATVTGLAMLGLLSYCTWQRRGQEMGLELACWFVVATTAAVVMGRAPYTTVEYALSARYSFPSVIMLASSLTLLGARLLAGRLHLAVPVALLLLAYWIHSWLTYPAALQPYVDKRVQRFNNDVYWIWGSPPGETKAIVDEAVKLGIYSPPEKPYPRPILSD